MAKSRNKHRANELEKTIETEVFENENFKRHLLETADKLSFPLDAVEKVIKDHIIQLPKIIYSNKQYAKRISIFGFFSIEIRKDSFKQLK